MILAWFIWVPPFSYTPTETRSVRPGLRLFLRRRRSIRLNAQREPSRRRRLREAARRSGAYRHDHHGGALGGEQDRSNGRSYSSSARHSTSAPSAAATITRGES